MNSIPTKEWRTVKKYSEYKVKRFLPSLPTPTGERKDERISFSRPKSEVAEVREYYFGDSDTSASEVGEACFLDSLKRATNERR